MRFVSINVLDLYSSIDAAAAWKKSHFILLDRSDFHVIDSQLIAVHTFTEHILMSLSVDKMLLPKYVKLSTNFRGLPFKVEIASSQLIHMYSILFAFTWRPMSPVTQSRLCRRNSA